ncbi:MAG: hypothetical protein ACYSTY_08315 [Planctomycetota bacterium]
MADSEKNVFVDGVNFSEVFQFHKVLRAVTIALRAPHLLIGLLMVVALMTAGRLWDGFTQPSLGPGGLLAEWSPEQQAEAEETVRVAVQAYVDPSRWPEGDLNLWEADAREALALTRAEYRDRRAATEAAAEEAADVEALRDAEFETFLATAQRINHARPMGTFEAAIGHATTEFGRIMKGFVYLEMPDVYGGANNLFRGMPVALWDNDKPFTIVYGLIFLVVMALGGGALSRMTACEFAMRERLRIREASDFALGTWRGLVLAPLLPLLIAAGLCAVLAVGGFLLMLPVVGILGGGLYGVALLVGFVISFLIIGYALGASLLIPAVACEKCDAADALQRAYAYVIHRPLHLLGYGLLAVLGMVLGYVLVSLFAGLIVNVTAAIVGAVTDNSAMRVAGGFELFDLTPAVDTGIHDAWHTEWSAWLVTFWQTLIVSIVAAYVLAYYFGASTIVYLLMRRACDGQAVEEIWRRGLVPGTLTPEPLPSDEAAATETAAAVPAARSAEPQKPEKSKPEPRKSEAEETGPSAAEEAPLPDDDDEEGEER